MYFSCNVKINVFCNHLFSLLTVLKQVLSLFEEADFRYRTELPNYLKEEEVEELINEDDTVLIQYNKQVIGLVEFEVIMDAARHYKLYYRLSNSIDKELNVSILDEIIDSFTMRNHVVKLAAHCFGDDDIYQDIFRKSGFEPEGQLESMLESDEKKHALVYYHKTIDEGHVHNSNE